MAESPKPHCAPISSRATSGNRRSSSGPSGRRASPGSSPSSSPGSPLLSLLAVVLMLPLKSFEPYVVTVDQTTGYIEVKSGLTRPANLTEQQAVTQANVVRYIRNREGYDPYAIEENFGIAALLSTGDAARELQADLQRRQSAESRQGLWPSQARPRRHQVGDLPERQHRDRRASRPPKRATRNRSCVIGSRSSAFATPIHPSATNGASRTRLASRSTRIAGTRKR